jgi:hypothetical protein
LNTNIIVMQDNLFALVSKLTKDLSELEAVEWFPDLTITVTVGVTPSFSGKGADYVTKYEIASNANVRTIRIFKESPDVISIWYIHDPKAYSRLATMKTTYRCSDLIDSDNSQKVVEMVTNFILKGDATVSLEGRVVTTDQLEKQAEAETRPRQQTNIFGLSISPIKY